MVAIIDYDAGNISSVQKACNYLGQETVLTRNAKEILAADRVILPGVGAFGQAMDNLRKYDLVPVIREICASGTPFMGICLGLQLLFDGSEESGGAEGLHILSGDVVKFTPEDNIKIPHIGWNSLHLQNNGRLFAECKEQDYVYFVHSYYLKAKESEIVKATCTYGTQQFDASVEKGNVFACQFHPEKSSDVGLGILNQFLGMNKEA